MKNSRSQPGSASAGGFGRPARRPVNPMLTSLDI
jgi:hypothetical protein